MLQSEVKVKLPTSETGTSILKRSWPRNASQGGFTLWELLMVVAIVAITVSMVQLSVGLSDETRDLKRVGKDLGKLFHLLNQEAVFESRNYAISVQDKGFIVLEYGEGKWLPTGQSFFDKIKMIADLGIDNRKPGYRYLGKNSTRAAYIDSLQR
jgi:prepilin-type N-terminal cleavage/methylation domain-containing protein